MKTNQHTAEQIIKILEQAEKGEQTIASLCREHGIAENTFYRWRKAYGGMSVNEAQRLKELEKETVRAIVPYAGWPPPSAPPSRPRTAPVDGAHDTA
jgi:putative transposase